MRLQFHTFGTNRRKYFLKRSRASVGNFLQQKVIVINSTGILLRRARVILWTLGYTTEDKDNQKHTHILSKDSLIFSVCVLR